MKIGIDARLMGETGVGRYIRNLIAHLAKIDTTNTYVVFTRDTSWTVPNERWSVRHVTVPWHSISEQLVMPWVFVKERLDLVHIPYFNIPIFYPGKMIATIHDLTILHFDTGKATTLPYILYKLRRVGYRIVLEVGLRRAASIIAVSETTKQEIINHFHLDPNKIAVTYEGVDEKFKRKREKEKSDYFLYVGNAYPHKNLETLVKAMQPIKDAKLILVGREDYFYKRLKESVNDDRIIFFGEADDETLANLYTHAKALVFPSRMEGFGLPALEALALGCPVIVSDIPVFHEILGEAATYFDSADPNDLIDKLIAVKKTHKHIALERYSWPKLAAHTLAIYESCAPL